MAFLFRIKLFIYDKLYHHHDARQIASVMVYSYWRLKSVKVGPGYIFIPVRLRKENKELQCKELLKYIRQAIAYRIKR